MFWFFSVIFLVVFFLIVISWFCLILRGFSFTRIGIFCGIEKYENKRMYVLVLKILKIIEYIRVY